MEKKNFNHYDWKRFSINEDNGSTSIFKIDPDVAHKVWEIVSSELRDGESFEDKFPTASGFFNFLNKNFK